MSKADEGKKKAQVASGKKETEKDGPKEPKKEVLIQMLDEQEKRNMFLGIFLLVAAVLTVTIFAALSTSDDDESEQERASLQIDDVFTTMQGSDNTTYSLDLVVYVTNTAKGDAENVRVEAAGIDYESRLTYAIGNETVSSIAGQKTSKLCVPLTIPKVKSYKILIMVFEDDTIKLKGYSVITINGSGTKKDFKVYYNRESTSGIKESDKDDEGISGFTVTMTIFFFLILIVEVLVVFNAMDFEAFRSAMRKMGENLRH